MQPVSQEAQGYSLKTESQPVEGYIRGRGYPLADTGLGYWIWRTSCLNTLLLQS